MSTAFGSIGRWFLISAGALAVAAAVVWVLVDEPGRSVTAGVLVLIAGIIGVQGVVWSVIQTRMFGRPSVLATVAQSGRQVGAVVTRVRTTASSIGSNPVMKLALTIDGVPREHSVLVPIHYVGSMRPGVTLPVRIDRAHPRVLVVEWDRVP